MIRNIIGHFRIVRIRSNLEFGKTDNILASVSASTLQQSFVNFSSKPTSQTALAVKKWKSSLDDETRNRLFEIKVEVSYWMKSRGSVVYKSQDICSWQLFSRLARKSAILMTLLLSNGNSYSHYQRRMPERGSTIGSAGKFASRLRTRYAFCSQRFWFSMCFFLMKSLCFNVGETRKTENPRRWN